MEQGAYVSTLGRRGGLKKAEVAWGWEQLQGEGGGGLLVNCQGEGKEAVRQHAEQWVGLI